MTDSSDDDAPVASTSKRTHPGPAAGPKNEFMRPAGFDDVQSIKKRPIDIATTSTELAHNEDMQAKAESVSPQKFKRRKEETSSGLITGANRKKKHRTTPTNEE